jgi:hypothetical protein
MKFFNALQIVTLLTTSPIWLNFLFYATFVGASFAFWIGILIAIILFCWVTAAFTGELGA